MTKPLVLILAVLVLAAVAVLALKPEILTRSAEYGPGPAPELASVPMPTDRAQPAG
jgi:hypothetical protein